MMRTGVTMRTTLDVDVDEVDDLARILKLGSRSAVVAAGLKALRERAALSEIAELIRRGELYPEAVAAPRRRP